MRGVHPRIGKREWSRAESVRFDRLDGERTVYAPRSTVPVSLACVLSPPASLSVAAAMGVPEGSGVSSVGTASGSMVSEGCGAVVTNGMKRC